MKREQMNIVIVGHVDHGKSTVIGRLLADTGSLPEGKLESVRESCKRNSRPFEYAFLLDALKDEQAQGITIDTARCFFKSQKRDYIILDAPGHIEFLKNMVTGASRAEAALLVIDGEEGIQENSKRHGHMVSMLGIKQVSVLVNKMDLVDYSEEVFKKIVGEYTAFLHEINVEPLSFIPVSARDGENFIGLSGKTPWYDGHSLLDQIDGFEKSPGKEELDFRMPVQDIYKFTENRDDRRIVAGTVESGTLSVGDEVVFLPSGKKTEVKSIEGFNTPEKYSASAGEAVGFTLGTQIYIRPGELMVKTSLEPPLVSSRFKANVFWVGKAPLIKGKKYKLKIGTARTFVKLAEVESVLDASDLSSDRTKQQVDKHDVAECIFEASKPIAFDTAGFLDVTSRFVLIDNYEISGGGIILDSLEMDNSSIKEHISEREIHWEKSGITPDERTSLYRHGSKFIVVTGPDDGEIKNLSLNLEKELFSKGFKAYYLSPANIREGLDSDQRLNGDYDNSVINRLGELARIMTDAGQIFITSLLHADDYDLEKLALLNQPNAILVVNLGGNQIQRYPIDLDLKREVDSPEIVDAVFGLLREKEVIPDYSI